MNVNALIGKIANKQKVYHMLSKVFKSWVIKTSLLIGLLLLNTSYVHAADGSNNDPYKTYNHHAYAMNNTLDKVIFKPVSIAYKTILPTPVRTGVSNFFSNLGEIPTIINDLLQGKFEQATSDSWRFFFNSTIGIGGLIDVAEDIGLPHHTQDLGLTFAHWGYQSSSYIVLPILGPSTVRDALALPMSYSYLAVYPYIDDVSLRNSLSALHFINQRAQLLQFDETIQQASFDPYTFQRNAYLQRRNYLIKNGNTQRDVKLNKKDEDFYFGGN